MTGFMAALRDGAAAPYRPLGRFPWHFARGKLGGDPAFTALLEQGAIPDHSRILDLGCGQGLLASWLGAARALFEAGHWPQGWPPPPRPASMHGVDLDGREVELARRALGEPARFEQGDIRTAAFGDVDAVVILDVLHFIAPAEQEAVLRRVRDSLAPKGVLLLRIGNADGGWEFRYSTWVDRSVTLFRGRGWPVLHCRPLEAWRALLTRLGFTVDPVPMADCTPFANVLLRASLGNGGP